jgi:hypothetical protein
LQAALASWLADDDAEALPALAALAAEGDRAAQILLAQIDLNVALAGPWLVRLPRAQRVALLRRPGGLSGQSWLREATADEPLAAAWLLQLDAASAADVEAFRRFSALGEDRAARVALLAMAQRQRRGFALIADDPAYPQALRYLVWREWARDPATAPRVAAEIAALPPGDPQVTLHAGRDPTPGDRAAWLAAAPTAEPLRVFCAAVCPRSQASCAAAAFELHGGVQGVARLGSPVEALVSSEDWFSSPRGLAALLRRPPETEERVARLAEIDACFADAYAAETARSQAD